MCSDTVPGNLVSKPGGPSAAASRAGRAMLIDAWTADVVVALRSSRVRPVLLKGAATAEWLYGGDRSVRSYNDADVMVGPADLGRARGVLGRLGFSDVTYSARVSGGAPPAHAETWYRDRDHAAVDLHRAIHRTEKLDPQLVWDVVSRDTQMLEVSGVDVEIPAERVRALQAVFHIRPRDHGGTQPWRDLERAIDQVRIGVWRDAAATASELGVQTVMASLLRLTPEGRTLADALGLPATVSRSLAAEYDRTAPASVRYVARLSGLGFVERTRLLSRRVFLTPDDLRLARPWAAKSRLHLAAGYLTRFAMLPVGLFRLLRYARSGGPSRIDDRN